MSAQNLDNSDRCAIGVTAESIPRTRLRTGRFGNLLSINHFGFFIDLYMLNFIIWDGSPVAFSIGPFVLRWYVLLFIVGFVAARILLAYVYKKEGKASADVEILTLYILGAALIGSRLGYVLFYEPNVIATKPLEAFLPFQFRPSIRFMGIERLSGYGALIAVMLVLWLYSWKKKSLSYLQVLDRVVLAIALTGIFIGLGSFLNSEITGTPTSSKAGVVFARPLMDDLRKLPCCIMRTPGGPSLLQDIEVRRDTALHPTTAGDSPVILYLFLKPGATEQLVKEFLIGDVKTFLYDHSTVTYEPGDEPLHYTIFQENTDLFTARVRTTGIARHPIQLYEFIFYFAFFIILFAIWRKYKSNTPTGRIAGIFLITSGIFNFLFGFLKVAAASFESTMALNVGQIVSVVMVIVGAVVLYLSFTTKSPTGDLARK